MPRNSQGLYTLPLPPVRPGELVESVWANTTLDDLASAMTASLPRDGSAPMTGPLTLSNDPITEARQATTKAYVDSFLAFATGFPIGGVMQFTAAVAPPGWLLCDGQAVSRTTYAELFAAIGVTFGSGDGANTFNVPDMRDWFVRGRGTSRTLGSTQAASLASHTHAVSDPGHTHTAFQTAHDHTITTGGHNHSISDPGHTHTPTLSRQAGDGGSFGAYASSGGNIGTTLPAAGTGISIAAVGNLGGSADARQPAVTVNGAATGVTLGATGGAETVPQNIALDFYIKAVEDSAGISGITNITTSDANMMSVDNSVPLSPELVIHSNVAFGIPKLDAQGKVALAQLPAGIQSFLGTFDASGGQNPSEKYPAATFVDGNTYLVSAAGTITVHDPNTNVAAPTMVELGWNLVYINNMTQPVGWYFLEAAVVTAAIASQVAFTPSGTIASTNVQAAIEELDSETQAALATKASLSNSLPGMDGTATAGVALDASRADHLHPTDTTRAPASAATASGTSFTPGGTISSATVQGAVNELDSEKVAKSGDTMTGPLAISTLRNPGNTVDAITIASDGKVTFPQTPVPAFTATVNTQAVGTSLAQLACTETFDPLNQFAASTFTPQVAGLYQVSLSAVNNVNDNWMFLAIAKNGSAVVPVYIPGMPAGLGGGSSIAISALIRMNGTTDFLSALGGNSIAGFSITSGLFSASLVRAD